MDVYLTPIGGAVTTVNSFNSRLEIIGGTGSGQIDALNVRSAFPFEDEARLTQDRLTGFAMAVDFAYSELEVVGIELGVGANLFTIESTHAGSTMLHTGAGDDSVEVVATGGVVDLQTADGKDMVRIGAIGAEMSLNTGEGDDRIHVGSRALASDGTLDGISSQLSVVGGAGFDMLKADDSGDTTANIGSLNATTLQGLGMAGSIAYGLVETLSILLGSGDDQFSISSTHSGSTQLSTGSGSDTVRIQAVSGPTFVSTGRGSDAVVIGTIAPLAGGKLDGIDDLLTVSGDEDSDTITLDESGDEGRNSAILDAATVNGFGMSGSISYEEMESVQIQLGSGIDQLRVEGTHDGTTKIVNKAGTDTVTMIDHQGPVTFVGGPDNDKLLLDSGYLK
ncbi:MAG: hypothetical protein ACOVNV_04630, partial [Pirellulaceae bacterium]